MLLYDDLLKMIPQLISYNDVIVHICTNCLMQSNGNFDLGYVVLDNVNMSCRYDDSILY